MTHKMLMLITYITCFAIYLATQQCINFYSRGNISSFMTENNSSRFFWTPGIFNRPTRGNLRSIERPMLKHRPIQNHYDFESLRFWARGRHCLIALPCAKIVHIAMFKFNSALSFTRKAPMKVARAHVHDAPHHPVSFTVE